MLERGRLQAAAGKERTTVLIEEPNVKGIQASLQRLDRTADKLGFVRWQWEYYRATYDYKIEDRQSNAEYFLRVNARVTRGKLERPDAELVLTDAYIGKATFPHGLDYQSPIPEPVMAVARKKLSELREALTA